MRMPGMLLLVAIPVWAGAFGAESVTLPLEEYKKLYREQLDRSREQEASGAPVYSLDRASYRLTLSEDRVEGEAVVEGRFISGEPAPIRLFGAGVIVAEAPEVEGGVLTGGEGLAFLPAGKQAFSIRINFLAAAVQEKDVHAVRMDVPRAVTNALKLDVPGHLQVLSAPGLEGGDGVRRFASTERMEVRYRGKPAAAAAAAPPEVDILTGITAQGPKFTATARFAVNRPGNGKLTVRLPSGARLVSPGEEDGALEAGPDNVLMVNAARLRTRVFGVSYTTPRQAKGPTAVGLPAVEGNSGSERCFFLVEPEDARMTAADQDAYPVVPAGRLSEDLLHAASPDGPVMQAPASRMVQLMVQEFVPVEAPGMVLDEIEFYVSYEATGRVLSVLRMRVPAAAGRRIAVNRVAEADVWSLRVNGVKRNVYSLDSDKWIVPLDGSGESLVELAFLAKSAKIKLQGRLEGVLPRTGLSARRLHVGIALPERVELMSMEGDLAPSATGRAQAPAEFVGRGHHFSTSFYGGGELRFAVFYKEPPRR
ncbi:MAG: hypothetical protein JW909_01160 [Planctomycetes bacterium]|nr:hypothetical protein [Planctomycetota bacterium]